MNSVAYIMALFIMGVLLGFSGLIEILVRHETSNAVPVLIGFIMITASWVCGLLVWLEGKASPLPPTNCSG